jgi:NADPH-dependent glutamate synthase beta subunit-like oxidoreductase/dihydroorotate dehydrogenase
MHKYTDFELPVEVAGVRFRNPFYVASGPTTMTVEQLERIDATGWGGASLKLTVDPAPYINRYPRYGYYPEKTYLTFTAERRLTLDRLLKLIEEGRQRAPNLVLFSNITYAGDEGAAGWVAMAKQCESAGAHINELNMCCPNMSFNVEVSGTYAKGPRTGASLGQNLEALAEIVRAIKAETSIPLFLKITPEGGRQAEIAAAALAAGADAVGGNANRLGIAGVNIHAPTSSDLMLQKELGMSCMNGEWLKPLALRDVYTMRKRCGEAAALTGTGGVLKWEDAVEMIMCGADLVGMCTATLVNGFGFMPAFIHGIKAFMRAKGYAHPRDMRDLLVATITAAPDLTIYAGHARKSINGLVAPCTYACPNSVPAQGYVRKVAEGEFEEAYQLIMSRSPLQSICGEVCDHPCEAACTRGLMDEPIRIREIKRCVLNMAAKEGWKPRIHAARAPRNDLKVAVVGAGPAGLACAYDLARAGYSVTVFEASTRLGGMLVSGIPAFRIDPETLAGEIDVIRSLGVAFETGACLGRDITLASLRQAGFASVFVAIGAQAGARLGVPGEDLPGAITAVDFLAAVANGNPPAIGKRVAVIGGGYSAMDAARTAVRLGAEEVYVLYRRTRDEMPATGDEIEEAEEEGIKIMYLVAPQKILGDKRVDGIRLLNYVLGEADESARRRPQEVPDTEFTLPVDTIIGALGQRVRLDQGMDLELTPRQTVAADETTGATNIVGVFAGGDCTRGPSSVIAAIADGKRAAAAIDRSLAGDAAFLVADIEKVMSDKDNVLERTGNRPRRKRVPLEKRAPVERRQDFDRYVTVLSAEAAVKEASRCLACGCGAGCEICKDICKVFAWNMDPQGRVMLDEDKCVACGMCIHRCPNKNIEMVQTGTDNLVT